MSRLRKAEARDAEKLHCKVCRQPMRGRGVRGTCQRCLLVQPMPGLWDPTELPPVEEIATRLPRFEILEPLGQGALGTVYKALDTVLGRFVAIKLMRVNPNNPEYGERFLREASVMAKLNHPSIVAICDYGIADDLQYLVLEWMEGGTLEDEGVGRRCLPPARALSLFGQVCDALQHAHAQGVVHRDVKPSNILLDRDGNAKLSDFGLVKGMLQDEFRKVSLTKTNMSMGTPLYMAPEQMKGSSKVDHRADIYAAGAVYYEMLTARSAKDRSEQASKTKGVPVLVGSAIDRALHESPDQRFDRIRDFKAEVVKRSQAKALWGKRLMMVAGYALFALASWKLSVALASEPGSQLSAEAVNGLPLGTFEEEIDLSAWTTLADYDFEDGWKERENQQLDLSREGAAEIVEGQLALNAIEDGVSVELERGSEAAANALVLNLRIRVDDYLGREGIENALLALVVDGKSRIALAEPRWGSGQPDLFVGSGQPLAPPGKVGSQLGVGRWHELWLVLDRKTFRIWIDGEPVYHGSADSLSSGWRPWGAESADLWIGGFHGKVDHLRVWEK